jgi:hypothetical protein
MGKTDGYHDGWKGIWSPLRYTEQRFCDDIWSLTEEQTNITAAQNKQNPMNDTHTETKTMGAHNIPSCMKMP